MRTGQGFALVFSVTSRQSFEEVEQFYNQILRVKDADKGEVPMVLIGNKCDLDAYRQVLSSEGKDLADSWDIPYFETSAATRYNITESFDQLVREVDRTLANPRLETTQVKSKKGMKKKVKKGGKKSSQGCTIL